MAAEELLNKAAAELFKRPAADSRRELPPPDEAAAAALPLAAAVDHGGPGLMGLMLLCNLPSPPFFAFCSLSMSLRRKMSNSTCGEGGTQKA